MTNEKDDTDDTETPIPLWRGCSESGGGKSAIQTLTKIKNSNNYYILVKILKIRTLCYQRKWKKS